jgi:hypothetical protein
MIRKNSPVRFLKSAGPRTRGDDPAFTPQLPVEAAGGVDVAVPERRQPLDLALSHVVNLLFARHDVPSPRLRFVIAD